jgi:hypothetical protein
MCRHGFRGAVASADSMCRRLGLSASLALRTLASYAAAGSTLPRGPLSAAGPARPNADSGWAHRISLDGKTVCCSSVGAAGDSGERAERLLLKECCLLLKFGIPISGSAAKGRPNDPLRL